MREIKLTRGKVARVSNADFAWLNAYRWYAEKLPTVWYARRKIRRQGGIVRTVSMHQLLAAVMGFASPDHADGDGLNNQRKNLRPASQTEQNGNQGLRSNNTSGFKGVSWNKDCRAWESYVSKGRKRFRLGFFKTATAAARAYDGAAKQLFGEFARTNF